MCVQQKCITATAPDAIAAVNDARGGFAYKNPLPGDGPTAGSLDLRPPSTPPAAPAPPADSTAAAPRSSSASSPTAVLSPSSATIANLASAGPVPAEASTPIGTALDFPLGFGFPSDDDVGGPFDTAVVAEDSAGSAAPGLADNPELAMRDIQNAAACGGLCGRAFQAWLCVGLAATAMLLP